MNNIVSNVALNWIGRRVLDWGGWLGTFGVAAVGFYNALSPANQKLVGQVLSGHWQDITLGALVPFVILVFSQVLSFHATVKDQVVIDGKKVDAEKSPIAKQAVQTVKVNTPPKPRNPLEALRNILPR